MQVLRSLGPQDDPRPLHFETRSPLEPRDIHDLRRLLWTELDRNGNEVPLTTIEVWCNETRCLAGLRFVYAHDTEATVGICLGERVTISLGVSEIAVAMDVGITSGPLGDVLVVRIAILVDSDAEACLLSLLTNRFVSFTPTPGIVGRTS